MGPTTPPAWPSRTPRLLALVGMVVLLALVVIVLQRDPVQLAMDTPEGTVQAWLQGVVDQEPDTDLLADIGCGVPLDDEMRFDGALRAVVIDSTIDGDGATVEVAITEFYGGGMFDDGWTHDATYALERAGDGWHITGFDWPWNECWNDPSNWGGSS